MSQIDEEFTERIHITTVTYPDVENNIDGVMKEEWIVYDDKLKMEDDNNE